MKKISLSLVALLSAGFALPAHADDLMIAASMQRCTTNEECALVTNSCKDNCGYVPVNRENLPTLQKEYQARCGKPMEANPTCNMNPPISAACVNARCTIDYAYANNAGAGDYQSGAYAVPEAPVPSKVSPEAYQNVDDRHGFTAYNLPQNQVKENTVGTLHTTIYVPPSAPVSGGNYVPVTQGTAPAPTTAPVPAAPVGVPPLAVPTDNTYATPPVAVPGPAPAIATPPPAPVPAPMAAPVAAPAIPATPVPPSANAVPDMTPSMPNLPPPSMPNLPPPSMPNLPPPSMPEAAGAPVTPVQPYQYVAPEAAPVAPPPTTPPPVPVAPPGSKPIPPSDLKPVESSVPPPGGTIPVNPDDPGAPPPEGTKVILKGSEMETQAGKSFSGTTTSEKKIQKLGSYN